MHGAAWIVRNRPCLSRVPTPPGRADAALPRSGHPTWSGGRRPGCSTYPTRACTWPSYGSGRPTRCPRAVAGSPGPPHIQLHDLPAAGRRRGEAAAVPARHVCGRSRGQSQERRLGGRSTLGTPSLPQRPGSRLPPPLRARRLRRSWLQAAGPARLLLRARWPPWRPPQPSGGRVAARDKKPRRRRFALTDRSGRGWREGGAPGDGRGWNEGLLPLMP